MPQDVINYVHLLITTFFIAIGLNVIKIIWYKVKDIWYMVNRRQSYGYMVFWKSIIGH